MKVYKDPIWYRAIAWPFLRISKLYEATREIKDSFWFLIALCHWMLWIGVLIFIVFAFISEPLAKIGGYIAGLGFVMMIINSLIHSFGCHFFKRKDISNSDPE